MTQHTDDFSTDPYSEPRWTNERGSNVWDSTDLELDMDTSLANCAARYSIAGPGSIEHEAQATFVASSGSHGKGGGAVRFDNTGVDDFYLAGCNQDSGDVLIRRVVGGGSATIATFTALMPHAAADWLTLRLAARGGEGANVVLDLWIVNHGTTKPADPGWVGDDNSPHASFTDTNAARLDAASHVQCGIGCQASGSQQDTRHDFYKQRAISDRSGPVLPVRSPMPYPRQIFLPG